MKRIAVFGGTFDPIHLGHMIMASYIAEEIELDEILFMPNGKPPHKDDNTVTEDEVRNKMIELSLGNDKRFSISLIEEQRQGTIYTIDTIDILLEKYPEDKFYFILGGDSLRTFKKWYRYKEILEKIELIVVDRYKCEGDDIESIIEDLKPFSMGITLVRMPYIQISSTEIRERVENKKSIRYLVDRKVEEFIEKNGLYQKNR